MKKSFRAIRLMVSFLVVAIAASAWFLLYQPNRNAIRDLLVDKAVLEAGARAETVLALVDRCREGAEYTAPFCQHKKQSSLRWITPL